MALERLSFKAVSEDDLAKIRQGLDNQEAGRGPAFSRTWDDNFPVYTHLNHGVVEVYVPNFRNEDGTLRVDVVNTHRVKDGSQYGTNIRCTRGIVAPELGLDGTCPLDDAARESSAWFFDVLEAVGIDPKDQNTQVRNMRGMINREKAVEDSRTSYIFPIITFETNESGKSKPKVMWLNLSSNQWEKMERALETLDEDKTPAGKLFIFNYGKNEDANKVDAVREMTIALKHKQFDATSATKLDALAVDWTPMMSTETVKDASIYPVDQLREVADQAVRNMTAKTNNLIIAGGTGAAKAAVIEVMDPTDRDVVDAEVVLDDLDLS